MTPELEQDSYFKIDLLCYEILEGRMERFYFTEMATLQATTLLPAEIKIISVQLLAYTDKGVYMDEETASGFKTIGNFNGFFLTNPEDDIHDCEMNLENDLYIGSHDDGEVSIIFPLDKPWYGLIENIWKKYELGEDLMTYLKSNNGYLIKINSEKKVIGEYVNFRDYLNNGFP